MGERRQVRCARRGRLRTAGGDLCSQDSRPSSGQGALWVQAAGATHLRLPPTERGPSRRRLSERQQLRGRAPGARWGSPCPCSGGEVRRMLLHPGGCSGWAEVTPGRLEGAGGAGAGSSHLGESRGSGSAIKGRADTHASAVPQRPPLSPHDAPPPPGHSPSLCAAPASPHPCPASSR